MTVTTINPISLRKTRDDRIRGKLLSCVLCVLLALPGLAAAKRPSASCTVLLPAYIETGSSFSVKIVDAPRYPGSGWVSPTVYTDVFYPTTDASIMTQNDTQTINRFGVTSATTSFVTPSMDDTAIDSSPSNPEAAATVTATISEPLKNGKARLSTCSASTPVMGLY